MIEDIVNSYLLDGYLNPEAATLIIGNKHNTLADGLFSNCVNSEAVPSVAVQNFRQAVLLPGFTRSAHFHEEIGFLRKILEDGASIVLIDRHPFSLVAGGKNYGVNAATLQTDQEVVWNFEQIFGAFESQGLLLRRFKEHYSRPEMDELPQYFSMAAIKR